jgi:hypothetical protein
LGSPSRLQLHCPSSIDLSTNSLPTLTSTLNSRRWASGQDGFGLLDEEATVRPDAGIRIDKSLRGDWHLAPNRVGPNELDPALNVLHQRSKLVTIEFVRPDFDTLSELPNPSVGTEPRLGDDWIVLVDIPDVVAVLFGDLESGPKHLQIVCQLRPIGAYGLNFLSRDRVSSVGSKAVVVVSH